MKTVTYFYQSNLERKYVSATRINKETHWETCKQRRSSKKYIFNLNDNFLHFSTSKLNFFYFELHHKNNFDVDDNYLSPL